MTVVIDASVAMAWCFEDEASEATDAIFAEVARYGAVVPELWMYEIPNVLVLARRRDRISESDARRFVAMLGRLAVERVVAPSVEELGWLAQAHTVTAYDAAYLHVAMTRGLPLATLDRRLTAAARDSGVALALARANGDGDGDG